MARLVILASGRGTNFSAIAESVADGRLPATIAALICNQPDAPVVGLAAGRGIPCELIANKDFPDRRTYDAKLLATLERLKPNWIILAGYMRLLPPEIVERWPHKILNIHPSLLPAFPGLRAQEQALAYGVRWTGCTVHFVGPGLDDGPIVAQEVLAVAPEDDAASLTTRLLKIENELYPRAIREVLEGKLKVEGRRVVRTR